MKPKFPYDTVETEDKEMGMFSRKDMVRLFGPLLVEQLLAQAHISCTPGVGFGSLGQGWIRFTGFNTTENTIEAMRRVTEVMR